MSSNVEQVKERLGIADVVSSYLKLEKAGSNLKAKCPFHNEKTPSFFVSPSRGTYYCFGCAAHGDIFSFVEQFEGLDFLGALKVLAARAGVELVRENPQTKSEKDRLYAVLEKAAEFFEKSLAGSAEARTYLATRGVTDETVKGWRLGFAPDAWRSLYDALLKGGFSLNEMYQAGLVKKGDKGNYDVFRGRVMFPIFDSSDRVIAFSGRIMPELDDGKAGKYINSPETPLYNKSRVLYGLNKAKFDIRKRNYSIIVEGQMDLIMSHQAGFTNTIAVSGTALSGELETAEALVTNLGLVTRLSKNIILAFDSDEAGLKAVERNGRIALNLGMDVKVAKIPAGADPADIVLRSKEEWAGIIKNSRHLVDFLLGIILERKLESRKLGTEIVTRVLPFVSLIESSVEQSHFVRKIAEAAGLKEDAVREDLGKIKLERKSGGTISAEPARQGRDESRRDFIARKIFGIVLWREEIKESDARVFRDRISTFLAPEALAALNALSGSEKDELVFEAEATYGKSDQFEKEVEEIFDNLEMECLNEKLITVRNELFAAEKAHDVLLASERSKIFQELSQKRNALGKKRMQIDKN